MDLAPVSRRGGDGALRFHWRGLAVDEAMAQLRLPEGAPLFRGGTLDLALDGAWDQGRIGHVDLPLVVTLRDTVLDVAGLDPTPFEELELRVEVRGPLSAPRVRFDHRALSDALVEQGKQELVNRAQSLVQEELGDELDVLAEEAGVEVDLDALEAGIGDSGALKGLLGRKK